MIQEFINELSKFVDRKINGIHTAVPGQILSFNNESGLATIKPNMKFKNSKGDLIDYPIISGVPVIFPQSSSQNISITFPIKENDGCLIVFAENSIEYWLYGQETDTELRFDLSNAICIPGLYPTSSENVKESFLNDSVIIANGDSKISISKDRIELLSKDIAINGKKFVF